MSAPTIAARAPQSTVTPQSTGTSQTTVTPRTTVMPRPLSLLGPLPLPRPRAPGSLLTVRQPGAAAGTARRPAAHGIRRARPDARRPGRGPRQPRDGHRHDHRGQLHAGQRPRVGPARAGRRQRPQRVPGRRPRRRADPAPAGRGVRRAVPGPVPARLRAALRTLPGSGRGRGGRHRGRSGLLLPAVQPRPAGPGGRRVGRVLPAAGRPARADAPGELRRLHARPDVPAEPADRAERAGGDVLPRARLAEHLGQLRAADTPRAGPGGPRRAAPAGRRTARRHGLARRALHLHGRLPADRGGSVPDARRTAPGWRSAAAPSG